MTRILLVDDDVNVRDALGTALEVAGHDVIVARDGMDALRLLPDVRPHAIVSDVTMPSMNGVEMVRRIRTMPRFAQIPIVLMSALVNVPSIAVSAMLRKPVTPSELLPLLDELTADACASDTMAWETAAVSANEGARRQPVDVPLTIAREEADTRATRELLRHIYRGMQLLEAQEERLHRLHSLSVNSEVAEQLCDCLRVSVATLIRLEHMSSGNAAAVFRGKP